MSDEEYSFGLCVNSSETLEIQGFSEILRRENLPIFTELLLSDDFSPENRRILIDVVEVFVYNSIMCGKNGVYHRSYHQRISHWEGGEIYVRGKSKRK